MIFLVEFLIIVFAIPALVEWMGLAQSLEQIEEQPVDFTFAEAKSLAAAAIHAAISALAEGKGLGGEFAARRYAERRGVSTRLLELARELEGGRS